MKSWIRKIRLSYLALFKLSAFCPLGVGKARYFLFLDNWSLNGLLKGSLE